MIYAGIDVAKLNHLISVISSNSEVLVEPFQFSNDYEGLRSLSLALDKYVRDQLLIDLEATADYDFRRNVIPVSEDTYPGHSRT